MPENELKKVNGWNEWAHRVLGDIEKIEKNQKEIFDSLTKLAIDIAVLKTKAAMIGGIWGAVVSIIVSVITVILHAHGGK